MHVVSLRDGHERYPPISLPAQQHISITADDHYLWCSTSWSGAGLSLGEFYDLRTGKFHLKTETVGFPSFFQDSQHWIATEKTDDNYAAVVRRISDGSEVGRVSLPKQPPENSPLSIESRGSGGWSDEKVTLYLHFYTPEPRDFTKESKNWLLDVKGRNFTIRSEPRSWCGTKDDRQSGPDWIEQCVRREVSQRETDDPIGRRREPKVFYDWQLCDLKTGVPLHRPIVFEDYVYRKITDDHRFLIAYGKELSVWQIPPAHAWGWIGIAAVLPWALLWVCFNSRGRKCAVASAGDSGSQMAGSGVAPDFQGL